MKLNCVANRRKVFESLPFLSEQPLFQLLCCGIFYCGTERTGYTHRTEFAVRRTARKHQRSTFQLPFVVVTRIGHCSICTFMHSLHLFRIIRASSIARRIRTPHYTILIGFGCEPRTVRPRNYYCCCCYASNKTTHIP